MNHALGPRTLLTSAARSAWVRFTEGLDRPGGRAVLGLMVSMVVTGRYRRPCRVAWRDGCWHYRWSDGVVFHEKPSIGRVAPVEIGVWEFWDYLPGPGDVAVVVGAGLGNEVSTLARLVGPSGRVYAVEAHPPTFARLVRLCRANRWAQVEPVHAAITDRSGTVTISDDESYFTNDIFRDGGTEVPACSLDDFVRDRDIAEVDFLTMNIEGAERLAVDGMVRLAPSVRHASISCHDFLGVEEKATREYVRTALLAYGFELRDRTDHPHPVVRDVLYASRET